MAEKECIYREAAVNAVLNLVPKVDEDGYCWVIRGDAARAIDSIPAADVRPVVTCEECDWHVDCGYHYCNKWCRPCPDNADFYCAYGERPNCGADMREES